MKTSNLKYTAILLVIAGSFFSCESIEPEEFPKTITPILIAQGELPGYGREGIPKQNLVINTQKTWEDLINAMCSVNESVRDNFTETDIDFSKYQVIAIFDTLLVGWTDITDIIEYADSIVIANLSTHTSMWVPQSYYIVKIPVSEKKIVFKNETKEFDPLEILTDYSVWVCIRYNGVNKLTFFPENTMQVENPNGINRIVNYCIMDNKMYWKDLETDDYPEHTFSYITFASKNEMHLRTGGLIFTDTRTYTFIRQTN